MYVLLFGNVSHLFLSYVSTIHLDVFCTFRIVVDKKVQFSKGFWKCVYTHIFIHLSHTPENLKGLYRYTVNYFSCQPGGSEREQPKNRTLLQTCLKLNGEQFWVAQSTGVHVCDVQW